MTSLEYSTSMSLDGFRKMFGGGPGPWSADSMERLVGRNPPCHLVPVFLGAGVRLFEDPALSAVKLTQVSVIEAPEVTHVTYHVVR
jgi:hypothetical protein